MVLGLYIGCHESCFVVFPDNLTEEIAKGGVINSKQELTTLLKKLKIREDWEEDILKEGADFTNSSFVYFSPMELISVTKITYAKDEGIKVFHGNLAFQQLGSFHFIKVTPKLPSNAKVKLVVETDLLK